MINEMSKEIEAAALTDFSQFKEMCPQIFELITEEAIKRIFVCGFTTGAMFGSSYNNNFSDLSKTGGR